MALSVSRETDEYSQLFDALSDSLERTFVARMIAPSGRSPGWLCCQWPPAKTVLISVFRHMEPPRWRHACHGR